VRHPTRMARELRSLRGAGSGQRRLRRRYYKFSLPSLDLDPREVDVWQAWAAPCASVTQHTCNVVAERASRRTVPFVV
jgi:hypothetical protein